MILFFGQSQNKYHCTQCDDI